MKLHAIVAITFVLSITEMAAQDGKLISKVQVSFPRDTLLAMEKTSAGTVEVADQTELYEITYLSDQLKVKGFLARPRQAGKFPCLIVNRGGNREFGAITRKRALSWLSRMAAWGYVVAASQYRGNAGGEGREEFGGADVNDVLNLIPLLGSLPEADTSRMGIYGWSRGGMMTYLALARTSGFKAAIIGAGAANAFKNVQERPEMESVFAELIPNYQSNKESALKARSASFWTEKLCKTTPVLLLHGSSDWRVPPEEALEMVHRLYETKHPFRFVFFEGGDHGLSEHQAEVSRLVKYWLNDYVRDGKPLPDLLPHGR